MTTNNITDEILKQVFGHIVLFPTYRIKCTHTEVKLFMSYLKYHIFIKLYFDIIMITVVNSSKAKSI
jgi:hypothetical protein